MLEWTLNFRLDAICFGLLLLAAAITLHAGLKRRHGRGIPRYSWIGLAVLLIAASIAPELAGEEERVRLRDMLEGIAPTYAQELSLLGHSKITESTSPDDPLYLSMIDAQKRWESVNSNVSDIYTFRKHTDGKVVLLVDSETDYNRNGKYDDEREQRTQIGEVYDEVTPSILRAFDGVATFDGIPATDRWGTWVSASVPMRDANGNVEAVLGVDYDARQWIRAIAWTRLAALGFVAILAVVLLASTVVVVVTRAELARRAAAEVERERLQQQLMLASRKAGMAEVATGVLHNVGNVLNSVNVSAGVLSDKFAKSKVASLAKATTMIRDNRDQVGEFLTSDPKGKLIPEYLFQISSLMSAEQESMVTELSHLTTSINHIKQIVAAQQSFATHSDINETFALETVFEDALRLDSSSLQRHHIEIVQEIGFCRRVTADRHKVLQILVNLISNAKKAMGDGEGPKRITIALKETLDEARQRCACITVSDTGTGISPENLPKVFTHGFTTRSDGHGFGLHASAIAAQQMKGTLTAASEGPGGGAAFTLMLPVAQEVQRS